jgi:pyruvate dehydrogenase E1 component
MPPAATPDRAAMISALEKKVLWLASWMIHNANHIRPGRDGLKVGGHQASCASLATILSALYFAVLKPHDRVAVKPHASPVFHAIQYLFGRQSRAQIENFRAYKGAQSYPSRTKDADDVDFSTGSVGLGVAQTLFASLTQDYARAHGFMAGRPDGRMIALVGDAELDEGNIYEALIDGWKHGVRNTWWIVDYNRQSLDAVIREGLWEKIETMFANFGWQVVILKYGRLMQAAFAEPGGDRLKAWIDKCPNQLYAALNYQGGAAFRRRLLDEIGDQGAVTRLIDKRNDAELAALMGNLGGHDVSTLIDAFEKIDHDGPVCFIAYTIKGAGLPLAGHKDNHAGLMTSAQIDGLRTAMGVREGFEWEPFEGLPYGEAELRAFLAAVPFAQGGERRHRAARIAVPARLAFPASPEMSTQQGFGLILQEIARAEEPQSDAAVADAEHRPAVPSPPQPGQARVAGGRGQAEFAEAGARVSAHALASRIVTCAPDVTVSTNLGPWVNRRGLFARDEKADLFRAEKIPSTYRWDCSPQGQHIELGIAEMNLFLLLSALGLSHTINGERLIPVGTLYDPFIQRGLDALNYACYQDARFMVVGTPSGVALAGEGGAHQSIGTPLIGMAQDGLAYFEPAFVDELAVIMRWGFDYMQRDEEAPGETPVRGRWLRDTHGGSVYLRLSTRPLAQPPRQMSEQLAADIVAGGYWMRAPGPNTELIIACTGAVAAEAIEATGLIAEDRRDVGLLAITSADRLNAGWSAASRARAEGLEATSHVEALLAGVGRDCAFVTVIDGHPATLAWLGGVYGHRCRSLGVEHFGQTGTLTDLYRHYRLDVNAILEAAEALGPAKPARHRLTAV